MFKIVLALVVTLLTAHAFQMGGRMRTSTTSLRMASDMVGASVEVGGKVYDPLGLLEVHPINPNVLPHPQWWRESELKHCRIAMLASVGAFTGQWGLAIPGYTPVADPVENLNKFVMDWPLGFAQIIASIAIIEGNFFPEGMWFGKGEREAGDWGYDPLGLFKNKTPAQKDDMRLKELKNGRLAMMAMAAYTAEHWIPGSVPFIPGKF